MIRVRRYEIIKLGLDGGEGDGVARGRKREVTEEKRARGVGGSPRWMSEAMGRCKARRRGRGQGDNRIPYTGI